MARYPESFSVIAEIIGDEAARKLCEAFGGDAIYVPKLESVEGRDRETIIRQTYNGLNVRELADVHGLTPRRIYQIVAGTMPVLPGQLSMLDE